MDKFFTTNRCQRCNNKDMSVRSMSWFTEEALCFRCMVQEDHIKKIIKKEYGSTVWFLLEGFGKFPKKEDLEFLKSKAEGIRDLSELEHVRNSLKNI